MDSEPRIQLKQFIKEVLSEKISKKVRGSKGIDKRKKLCKAVILGEVSD